MFSAFFAVKICWKEWERGLTAKSAKIAERERGKRGRGMIEGRGGKGEEKMEGKGSRED